MSDSPNSVAQAPKKKRGRPMKRTLNNVGECTSNSTKMNFTPYVINVVNGEDVAIKILSFAQERQMDVFIISTSGCVSVVILQQFSSSIDTMTYEGHFDILSLSGSYLLYENGAHENQTKNLRISICSDDGHVIGGRVGGKLIASGLVQVVVGTFMHTSNNSNAKIKENVSSITRKSPTIQLNKTSPTSSPQTIARPPYSQREWRNSDRERQRLDDLRAYYQHND